MGEPTGWYVQSLGVYFLSFFSDGLSWVMGGGGANGVEQDNLIDPNSILALVPRSELQWGFWG